MVTWIAVAEAWSWPLNLLIMPRLRTHYAEILAPRMSTWLALDAAQGYEHSNSRHTSWLHIKRAALKIQWKEFAFLCANPHSRPQKYWHSCVYTRVAWTPSWGPRSFTRRQESGVLIVAACSATIPATRCDYTYRHVTRPPTHLTVCAVNLQNMNPLKS